LGLETQQLRVSSTYIFINDKLNAFQRPPRHTAVTDTHEDDLVQQNFTYQRDLASLDARVIFYFSIKLNQVLFI
jgi:hypothetical protein